MKHWNTLLSESARRAFYELEDSMQKRMKKAFKFLSKNPFQKRSGADIKKLAGSFNPAFYRLRVGDYRIIYLIDKKEVKITSIIHRSHGYKWLDA
ncbi:MAG: type II toxin-antitoxin system RelE/ParE family toxin [Candidatus Micrarchaeota archaeon]